MAKLVADFNPFKNLTQKIASLKASGHEQLLKLYQHASKASKQAQVLKKNTKAKELTMVPRETKNNANAKF